MRIIEAPGIELHEIDRSGYDEAEDTDVLGTTAFLMGFADKGEDYTTKWIKSMSTFINNYGYPTNEAERYFYNAAYEILDRGGNIYASKLPYDNNSLKKYAYCSYSVDTKLCTLSSPYEIGTSITNKTSGRNIFEFLIFPTTSAYSPLSVDLSHEDTKMLNLPILNDMFTYLSKKCNFGYRTQYILNKYFYVDTVENYKTYSAYLLSSLMSDNSDDLCNFNSICSNLNIHFTSDELSMVGNLKDSLLTIGDTFEEQISKFGKTISLRQYNEYLDQLSDEVTTKLSGDTTAKESLLREISNYKKNELLNTKYTELKQIDEQITSYIEIKSNPISDKNSGLIDIASYDKLKVDEDKVPEGEIVIVDLTRQKYNKDYTEAENTKEYIGLLPVITTASNALYYQRFIENNLETQKDYTILSCINNTYTPDYTIISNEKIPLTSVLSNLNNDDILEKEIVGFVQNLGCEENVTENQETLSKTAVEYFPSITYKNGRLNIENLKKIGIVVFKMFIDESNDGRIGFEPLEAFCGSLNRKDTDINTGATTFIDRIVNTNSRYINCFSNVKFSKEKNLKLYDTDKCSTFLIKNQCATSLGLYDKDCDKDISLKESIDNAMNLIFENNKDNITTNIDILVDAGVSNIAQFIKSVYKSGKGKFDFDNDKAFLFRMESNTNVTEWKRIIEKYNQFCRYTRTDCMFLADGMRPLCLQGQEKIVRPSKPENTVLDNIVGRIKWMSGLINSSYGAGYCNWFKQVDRYSSEYFWCPPSIKAAGVYVYTDAYSHYWMAPAGLRRGNISEDVVDVAFNPTQDEAGKIYINRWNYALQYPIEGIVLDGQKTFQKEKTAFDRVNVRRLFLGLEKDVRYVAKFFTYEGITSYMMQRFVDSLTPIFEEAKDKEGILDYYIICDSRNNNTQTVENNELHCTIAVKPVKSLEYIVLNFIATSQGASVQEVAEGNV